MTNGVAHRVAEPGGLRALRRVPRPLRRPAACRDLLERYVAADPRGSDHRASSELTAAARRALHRHDATTTRSPRSRPSQPVRMLLRGGRGGTASPGHADPAASRAPSTSWPIPDAEADHVVPRRPAAAFAPSRPRSRRRRRATQLRCRPDVRCRRRHYTGRRQRASGRRTRRTTGSRSRRARASATSPRRSPRTSSCVGTGSVDLWLASTAADTDLEVTLSEVRPDGTEIYVQSGWLRASHRKLDDTASHRAAPGADPPRGRRGRRCPPASSRRLRVELFPFAHAFRAGSRSASPSTPPAATARSGRSTRSPTASRSPSRPTTPAPVAGRARRWCPA